MNCRECQDWLQRTLDERRLDVTAEVRDHLRGCETCRADVAAARVMLGGLTSPVANATMTSRITDAVTRDREKRRLRSIYRWYATAGLAASLLLLYIFSGLTPSPKTPVAKKNEPNITERAQDAQKAVTSLTLAAAEKAKSRITALLPETPPLDVALPPLPEMEEPFDPMALKQAVTQSFEPFSRTAVQAVDFFTREMPVLDFSKN